MGEGISVNDHQAHQMVKDYKSVQFGDIVVVAEDRIQRAPRVPMIRRACTNHTQQERVVLQDRPKDFSIAVPTGDNRLHWIGCL